MRVILATIALLWSVLAHSAPPEKVQVLDQWQCGEAMCAILFDDQGRFLLAIADEQGIHSLFHRSVLIWKRGDKDA